MPLLQYAESGVEYLIPYAKKKLRELHEYMNYSKVASFAKHINVSDGSAIYLNSLALQNGDFVDKIRITGGTFIMVGKQLLLNQKWGVFNTTSGPAAADEWRSGNVVLLWNPVSLYQIKNHKNGKPIESVTLVCPESQYSFFVGAGIFDKKLICVTVNSAALKYVIKVWWYNDDKTVERWTEIPVVYSGFTAYPVETMYFPSHGFRFKSDGSEAQALCEYSAMNLFSVVFNSGTKRLKLQLTGADPTEYAATVSLHEEDYGAIAGYTDHVANSSAGFTTTNKSSISYSGTLRDPLAIDYDADDNLIMGRFSQTTSFSADWTGTFNNDLLGGGQGGGWIRTGDLSKNLVATNIFEWMKSTDGGDTWVAESSVEFPSSSYNLQCSGRSDEVYDIVPPIIPPVTTGSGTVSAISGMACASPVADAYGIPLHGTGYWYPGMVIDTVHSENGLYGAGIRSATPRFFAIDPRARVVAARVVTQSIPNPVMVMLDAVNAVIFTITGTAVVADESGLYRSTRKELKRTAIGGDPLYSSLTQVPAPAPAQVIAWGDVLAEDIEILNETDAVYRKTEKVVLQSNEVTTNIDLFADAIAGVASEWTITFAQAGKGTIDSIMLGGINILGAPVKLKPLVFANPLTPVADQITNRSRYTLVTATTPSATTLVITGRQTAFGVARTLNEVAPIVVIVDEVPEGETREPNTAVVTRTATGVLTAPYGMYPMHNTTVNYASKLFLTEAANISIDVGSPTSGSTDRSLSGPFLSNGSNYGSTEGEFGGGNYDRSYHMAVIGNNTAVAYVEGGINYTSAAGVRTLTGLAADIETRQRVRDHELTEAQGQAILDARLEAEVAAMGGYATIIEKSGVFVPDSVIFVGPAGGGTKGVDGGGNGVPDPAVT